MKENVIRTHAGDLQLSAVLFDEAFRLDPEKTRQPEPALLHRHTDYEIFFVLRGKLTVRGEGVCVEAKENHAVILPPLFEHATDAKNLHGYCMYFTPEKKARATDRSYKEITCALGKQITVLPLEEAGIFYIRQLAKVLRSAAGRGDEVHLVSLLFSELFRPLLSRQITETDGQSQRYTNRIDLFIAEHYREKIRLSDLAETLYLCPKQVTRIIRKNYGCSFSNLVQDHRLRLARAMLESTEESISSIARAVGFEYENYFYTLFRKAYTITPAEYREKHRPYL